MSCCGQGRAALRNTTPNPPTRPAADRTERRVLVRYRATAAVVVRGITSGRLYEFDGVQPLVYVTEADAAALLRSRYFIRAD